MIIWTFRIQKLKIGSLADFEKKSFSSLFLMRKPLSSDQKWFLRPYFPLIGGIFVLKSGLRFLFRALEVPIRKVRKRPFFSLKSARCHKGVSRGVASIPGFNLFQVELQKKHFVKILTLAKIFWTASPTSSDRTKGRDGFREAAH